VVCLKPTSLRENSLHLSKICVWCAVSITRNVGQLLFEETVIQKNYPNIFIQFIAMLKDNDTNRLRYVLICC